MAAHGRGVQADASEVRDGAQEFALGALAVLLIDARSRAAMLAVDASLSGLLRACHAAEGYEADYEARRRGAAAKALAGSLQRDAAVRASLVATGQLTAVIELMEATGPGSERVRFAAAAALAALIVDEAAMEAIAARGEATLMFEHSISALQARCSTDC